MDPGAQIRALKASFWRQTAPLKRDLSEEHKAVLLVVIGHRRKGGVSKARVGEILGLEASSYLDDLLSFGLIYCRPVQGVEFLAADARGFACPGFSVLSPTSPRSKSSKSGSTRRKKFER